MAADKQYKVGRRVRATNKLMTALIGRGKTASWLLATTGNTSGVRRTVPVTPVDLEGERYLVAPYGEVGWVRNIRSEPNATLTRGGASVRITAVEVSGDEAARALSKYYRENTKYVAPYMDIPGDGTITDFASVTYRYPVFKAVSR